MTTFNLQQSLSSVEALKTTYYPDVVIRGTIFGGDLAWLLRMRLLKDEKALGW